MSSTQTPGSSLSAFCIVISSCKITAAYRVLKSREIVLKNKLLMFMFTTVSQCSLDSRNLLVNESIICSILCSLEKLKGLFPIQCNLVVYKALTNGYFNSYICSNHPPITLSPLI
jgi:hypothetical protein